MSIFVVRGVVTMLNCKFIPKSYCIRSFRRSLSAPLVARMPWGLQRSKNNLNFVRIFMASTIVTVILVIAWIVGMATAHTMGGLIHVLPLIALAIIVVSFFRGINNFQHIDFGG